MSTPQKLRGLDGQVFLDENDESYCVWRAEFDEEENCCRCNANMQTPELRRFCELDETGALLMQQAFESLGLTARSYDRIRRVARTIADLAGSESILPEHLSEAIQYRTHQLIQN